jgi:hypothetical protein
MCTLGISDLFHYRIGDPVEVRMMICPEPAGPLDPDAPMRVEEVWLPATVTHVSRLVITIAFADGARRAFERHDVRRSAANDRRKPS